VAPARPRKPPGRPLAFAAAGAGAVLVLILLAFAFSRGGSADPSGERREDPLAELRELAESGADPERILRKCGEARPRVAGSPGEARLREIEARARRELAEREKARGTKTDQALSRIRSVVAADPEFQRQAEVSSLFAAAMKEAAGRETEVEREWLSYERRLETAAREAAEAARSEADRLAASGDFAGALARIDRVPPALRAAAAAKALEGRRREIEEQARIDALPPPPLHEASHCWKSDTVAALSDRLLPKDSADGSIPRFTWWDRRGSVEWVTFGFPRRRTVSACEVYWFDDRAGGGQCRVPESWKILYLAGEEWKEVRGTSAFGVEPDRFNRATFEPVLARALRIEAKLRPDVSGGILEWTIPGTEDIPRPLVQPPPPPPPPPPAAPSAPGELVLDAAQARVRGDRITIKERDGRKYVGNWHRPEDVVEFSLSSPRAGRYRVVLEYAALEGSGGELQARFAGESLEARLASTGDWKKYVPLDLGEVALPEGEVAVRLQGKTVLGDGLMNFRCLRLLRK
jgi:hypothetical protein